MRLIDADKLKEEWSDDICAFYDYTHIHVLESIDNAQTVDAEPVRHGRWVKSRAMVGLNPTTLEPKIGDTDRCSICETDFISVPVKYKYCPNCGAKMDLGGDAK